MVSIQRTIEPVGPASLFAFSVDNKVLGGKIVYAVLLGMVYAGLDVAVQLPKTTWKHSQA